MSAVPVASQGADNQDATVQALQAPLAPRPRSALWLDPAFEWLTNRWAETIKDVAQSVLGRYVDVAIQLPAAEPEPPAEPIEISGDFSIRMTGEVTKVSDGIIAKDMFGAYPG